MPTKSKDVATRNNQSQRNKTPMDVKIRKTRKRIRSEYTAVPGQENARRIKNVMVDVAWGTGHLNMPLERIIRGLARLARKGVRTAQMREIGGVPVVLSWEIPVGTFAIRTADRITAFSSEIAEPIVSVPCEAIDNPAVAAVIIAETPQLELASYRNPGAR